MSQWDERKGAGEGNVRFEVQTQIGHNHDKRWNSRLENIQCEKGNRLHFNSDATSGRRRI